MSDMDLAENQDSVVDAPVESATPAAAPAPIRPRKKSIFRDPVVRWMAVGAVVLIVLYLATVLSALFMGMMAPTEPRTKVERDLQVYELQAMQEPRNTEVWRNYITALVANKQYSKAQGVIDQAKRALDQTATLDIDSAQVSLYYATKDYDKAVKGADDVRTKLKKYYETAKKRKGSPESQGAAIHFNYWAVTLIKAESLVELGKTKEAVKALDEYLKANAGDAAVLIRRGELRTELGDKKGAAADFRAALKFLPGDKNATEGLKKIGAKQ